MTFLGKICSVCFGPPVTVDDDELLFAENEPFQTDQQLWHVALADCATGQVSCAAVSANDIVEDHSEVQSGPHGTFLGVYDGHGGPQAAEFLRDNIFDRYEKALAPKSEEISGAPKDNALPGPLISALSSCEKDLLADVRARWLSRPQLASVGSCALLAAIAFPSKSQASHDRTAPAVEIHVASLGDSRAVLGAIQGGGGTKGPITPVQLSTDHNANYSAIRHELTRKFPHDKDIVVEKNGVWRVKGIIQVSHAIGDFYLKLQEFQDAPLHAKFRLPVPLREAALSSEPTLLRRTLNPHSDKFVVLASDGLYEYLDNQETVDLVNKYPREGIAQRLVTVALMRAAKKKGVTYAQLKSITGGRRREFHDDISVIVHFFDFAKMGNFQGSAAKVSIQAGEEFKGVRTEGKPEKDEEMERTPIQGNFWRPTLDL